jgi:uncharacterized protein YjbI with pentapeptide repeats
MFSDMKPAEKRLFEACQKGEILDLGNKRPTEKTVENEIRGEFLRVLILSNNQEIEENKRKYYLKWKLNIRKKILKIDPKGIMFTGAYISGIFDFSFCGTDLPFKFKNAIFEKEINFSDSKIKLLDLSGSQVDGINAQGLFCQSQIFITNIKSTSEINFISAQIDGSIICSNSKFTRVLDKSYEGKSYLVKDGKLKNKEIITLNLNSAKINGNVLLDKKFISKGEVSFTSAQIEGGVICSDAKFINKNKKALSFNSAKINGNVFLGENFCISGDLDFSASKIRKISISKKIRIKGNFLFSVMMVDTIHISNLSFNEKHLKKLRLDGLIYNHLSGTNLDSKTLLEWLGKMPEFKPQPYKQLAKVLRNMGHNEDANSIMIKYNDELRKKDFLTCDRLFISILKWIYGKTAGYGYKPLRVLGTMFIVWLFCSLFYWNASKVAVFAPTNPLVFQKKDFYQCTVNSDGTPWTDFFNYSKYNSSNNWVLNENLDGEYTTFNPFMYSLDVILPIVDLQVEKDWGQYVSSNNGTLNDFTRWLMWFEILFGWTYSLMLVAILSGLAKNEKD